MDEPMPSRQADTQAGSGQRREFSGRWVVLGLFAFGLLSTGIIWWYWEQHMEPFMPLQMALAEEFPDSSPRVEGGREKLHRHTPSILRVTMRVSFDPTAAEAPLDEMLTRVAQVADEKIRLQDYENFELHLYQPLAEKELRQQSISEPMSEVLDLLQARTADRRNL